MKNSETEFETLLVNRNKLDTEAKLKVSISSDQPNSNRFYFSNVDLKFGFDEDWNQFNSFEVSNDDFEIFWLKNQNNQFHNQTVFRSDSKDIANIIWEELLKKVGIV